MLIIKKSLVDVLVGICKLEHPKEACGMVAGRDGIPRWLTSFTNVSSNPCFAFEVSEEEQRRVWDYLDVTGQEPVVFWHSHTAENADPSGTDRQAAWLDGAHYLIYSTLFDELKSCVLRDRVLVPEEIQCQE